MAKVEEKILVEEKAYMSAMLECISTEEFKKATAEMSKGEQFAAMWGMAFCSMYASTHVPKLIFPERLHYPCNHCGSCPIWLAAFEEGTGLDTMPKVIYECVKRGCDLVGTEVKEDAEV